MPRPCISTPTPTTQPMCVTALDRPQKAPLDGVPAAVNITLVNRQKDKVGVSAKKSNKLLDSLKIDPDLEMLLPTTTAHEDKAHKKAIQKEGVIHPLIADEQGVLIDGIRTYKVCRELNVRDVWVVTLTGLTKEEKRHKRLALNVNRRHLTRKQKRELLRQELLRNPAISSGHLARIVGCSHNTVQKIREEMIANGQIDRCPIEASDGRVFKASGVLTPLHGVPQTQAHLADPSNHVDNGKILPFQKWKSQVIEKQRSRLADLGASLPQEQECRIHCCRFQDLLTVDPSIKGEASLVLTDIPWTAAFLPELDDFAKTTKEVLKPGGILVCYSGVIHLFDLGAALSKHLTYVWTITQTYPTSIHCETGGVKRGSLSVYDKWRPIVVFVNGPMPSLRESALQDWVQGQGSQKDLHDWQQSLDEVKFYINAFTDQGDLTVDLCGGSFTTAHAAKELGRRFAGCDVNERCVNLGRYRISQVSPQSSLSA